MVVKLLWIVAYVCEVIYKFVDVGQLVDGPCTLFSGKLYKYCVRNVYEALKTLILTLFPIL